MSIFHEPPNRIRNVDNVERLHGVIGFFSAWSDGQKFEIVGEGFYPFDSAPCASLRVILSLPKD
jgi:hypothetical protein